MATEARNKSNARPGRPVGNMMNSRCTLGSVRQLRVEAYSIDGYRAVPLSGDLRGTSGAYTASGPGERI